MVWSTLEEVTCLHWRVNIRQVLSNYMNHHSESVLCRRHYLKTIEIYYWFIEFLISTTISSSWLSIDNTLIVCVWWTWSFVLQCKPTHHDARCSVSVTKVVKWYPSERRVEIALSLCFVQSSANSPEFVPIETFQSWLLHERSYICSDLLSPSVQHVLRCN